MKHSVQIRRATVHDSSTVRDLLQQLGYQQNFAQLEEQLSAPGSGRHAFVADVDGQVVGFMSLHISDWFHRADPAARLSAVVVDAQYRRMGIGRALVEFAEITASQLGCSYIELTSNLRRRVDGTYDFYDALGYERAQETTYFRKSLGAVSP
jgi:GNAT superfamily N-acetyltransferase